MDNNRCCARGIRLKVVDLPATHALEVVGPLGHGQALYENPCELVPVFCTVSLQLHALTDSGPYALLGGSSRSR